MPQHTWYGAAAGYLEMWMAMMVPMMLPSLIPMLLRYRQSVGAHGVHLHGLIAMVGIGYFVIWAVIGVAAYGAGLGLTGAETRWTAATRWPPVVSSLMLLAAGAVQLTSWKARQLTLCREGAEAGCPPASNGLAAWQHGLRLGVRCSLSCGSLMTALLVIGMMDPLVMAAVTLAISAERLAPSPLRIARLTGVVMVVAGVLAIARSLTYAATSAR